MLLAEEERNSRKDEDFLYVTLKTKTKAKVKLFRRMCGLQDINVLRANERDARIYDDRSIQDQGKDWEIVDDPEYSMEIVDGDFGTTQ